MLPNASPVGSWLTISDLFSFSETVKSAMGTHVNLAIRDSGGCVTLVIQVVPGENFTVQSGKKITTTDADQVISTVNGIRGQIGC